MGGRALAHGPFFRPTRGAAAEDEGFVPAGAGHPLHLHILSHVMPVPGQQLPLESLELRPRGPDQVLGLAGAQRLEVLLADEAPPPARSRAAEWQGAR
jgi:hypothetical protein